MRSLSALEVSRSFDRPPTLDSVITPRSFAAATASIVLASCAATAPVQSSAPDAPVRGGKMTVALLNEIPNLDPLRVSDGAQFDTAGPVVSQLYDSLVSFDRVSGEVVPSLATWTVSADSKAYEFEIRPDATWSDGRPIIAEDFVTTLRAAARSKVAASRGPLSRIEGAEDYRLGKATSVSGLVATGRHLTVRLAVSLCGFLGVLPITPPLPTHVFGRYLSDGDLTMNTDDASEHLAPTVTSGAFTFKEWRRGDQIVLRSNPRYWHGPPLLDELVFRTVARSAVASEIQSGKLDVAPLGTSDVEIVHALDRDPNLRVSRIAGPSYTFLGWNARSNVAAFRDKRIRQALAYGLDVRLAIQRIVLGEAEPVRGHMGTTSWAFSPGLNPYPYDPAKAEALIRSAGYAKGADGIYAKDGQPLAFTLVTNSNNATRTPLVQFAADQYARIGVRVTPLLDEFGALVRRFAESDPTIEAFVLGWVHVGDPNPSGIWHSSSVFEGKARPANLVGYVDPDLDRAIDAGRFGPDCSIVARKAAYAAFERIVNEDQPYNFLYQPHTFVAISSRVRAISPGAYVPLPDSHLWWLAPPQ
jgi:peptide/nickel transport system substrate-binding protein